MENPAYNKKYNLRLPQELYTKIEQFGRNYDRSVNEQIVYMLKTWQEPSVVEDRLARIEEQIFPNESKRAVGQ
jgi:hypothetical protein